MENKFKNSKPSLKSSTKKITSDVSFEKIITNALKIPGVKVNREEFLREMLEDELVDIDNIIEVGPVAAGIPGGLAMAATIPLDALQFYGMTLRMAQEITYLYGAKDLWKDGKVDSDLVRDQLILYCGVMFGVSGAAAGLRLISIHVAKQVGETLTRQAVTRVMYPLIKKISKSLGKDITKGVVANGATKIVPILGGLLSGGLTFLSMRPMGERLVKALNEANFEYSEQKALLDYRVLKQIADKCESGDFDKAGYIWSCIN